MARTPRTLTDRLRSAGSYPRAARLPRDRSLFAHAQMLLPRLLVIGIFALIALAIPQLAQAQIEFPSADFGVPIRISAERSYRWQEGPYEVWLMWGGCRIQQGEVTAKSKAGVVWIARADENGIRPNKVVSYLEGDVVVDYPRGSAPASAPSDETETAQGEAEATRVTDQTWLGRFYSRAEVDVRTAVVGGRPEPPPVIYQRGVAAWAPEGQMPTVTPAQFTLPPPGPQTEVVQGIPDGTRRIRIRRRSSVGVQARWFPVPERNEWVGVVGGGVNLLVEGLPDLGTIDVSTDRLVIWTTGTTAPDLAGDALQGSNTPLEIYMEGNIVFRQGDRVIYARSMYYNIQHQYGVVLDAEMLTPVPEYRGLLRLKADVLQQLDRYNFVASGGALTTSRMGVPNYWFQADQISFQDLQQPRVNPVTGQPEFDPFTGQPVIDHKLLATADNIFVYLGGLPVFYWPVIATDASKRSYYIDDLQIGHDNVFGAQLRTDFDVFQLLGWQNPPPGVDWTVALDVLSERGVGFGTDVVYQMADPFGIALRHQGQFHAWGINDSAGTDNLGLDRRDVPFFDKFRGRVVGQHRSWFDNGWQLTGEVGYISDTNFLEAYYESEWDQWKDQDTLLELRRTWDAQSLAIWSQARVNDFFTQTNWWPRLDHFWLGGSLLENRLTYYSHSHVGYGKIETADYQLFPPGQFNYLAWEPIINPTTPSSREGVRAGTRQELDLPLEAGPVKVVPYVLGDATYWGEDLNGEEMTRLYGQVGVRASLSMWNVDPSVQRPLLNLNGLAHKITFEADGFFADANQNLSDLTLYDPLDDDSQEAFRRRFLFTTFPGAVAIPQQFDERYYALRRGMQGDVSAQSMEIADDLFLINLGVRQRWQTKRGLPGNEHVIDWITLDMGASIFPDPDRDNFGEVIGPLTYDLRWYVGDRFTVLSDGYADFFTDGLKMATLGAIIHKPQVGQLYAGIRAADGPFTSTVLLSSFTYRMSDKWMATAGSAYDLGPTGDIGSSLAFTRIGESFLMTGGFAYDVSRNNLSIQLMIEPRVIASRFGKIGGEPLPPVGLFGLE